MNATVPNAGAVARKWVRRAESAGDEYKAGVNGARSWSQAASQAEGAYKAGVAAAAGRGAYASGVNKAGDARWKARSLNVGADRFTSGVSDAEGRMATGIGPVLEAIGRVELAPRGPVGSDANYGRATTMAKALRQLRIGK